MRSLDASGIFFCTQSEYFTISNGVCKVNFLALVVSEILGGHKFTLEDPAPPGRPLAKDILYPKQVLYHILLCFNVNFLAVAVSEILGRSQMYIRGAPRPLDAP